MSYVRPARKTEVLSWLEQYTNNGTVEVDAEELADALLKEWDLVGFYQSPV